MREESRPAMSAELHRQADRLAQLAEGKEPRIANRIEKQVDAMRAAAIREESGR